MPYNLSRDYLTLPAPEASDQRTAINYSDDVSAPVFGLSGLCLRVYKSGKRVWYITYYNRNSKKARLTLDDSSRLDYHDARKVAGIKFSEAKIAAVDPVEAKRATLAEQKRKASGVDSFAGLAAEYIERYAKKEKRSWKEDRRRIDKYLNPAWGKRDAKDVGRKDVRALLDKITDSGAPGEANRVHALVRKMFNWAIRRDLIETVNPGINHDANPETARKRYLSADEIRVIWRKLETEKRDFADLCKLGLLTGQRLKSLRGLEWSELDLVNGWMTIPASRMKQKRVKEHDHRVPLVGLAIDILRARDSANDKHSRFVFPAHRRDAKGEMSFMTKIGAFKHLQDALRAEFPDAAKKLGYLDPTFHDFRRTLSTHVNEMHSAELSIAVEHVLDHVVGTAVSRVYNVSDHHMGKRDALIAWNAAICAIVGAEHRIEESNVQKLRAA